MSIGHHALIHRSPRSAANRRARRDRLGAKIRSSGRQERVFGGCLVIVAIHLAAVALLFPGDAGAPARVGLLLAVAVVPGVLGVLFLARGRVVRVLLAALIGLGATVTGLATSVPHAVLTGLGGADVTGILATMAGIVLVVVAFWIARHGRRLVVKFAVGDSGVLRDRAVADRTSHQRGSRDPRPTPDDRGRANTRLCRGTRRHVLGS